GGGGGRERRRRGGGRTLFGKILTSVESLERLWEGGGLIRPGYPSDLVEKRCRCEHASGPKAPDSRVYLTPRLVGEAGTDGAVVGATMYRPIGPDLFELMSILVPSALGAASGSAQKGGYDDPWRIRYLVSPVATPI